MKYLSVLLLWLFIAIEACSQTRIIPPAVIKSKGRKVVIQTEDTTKITLNDSIELFHIGNNFYIKNKNYQGKCKIIFSNEGIKIPKIYHDTIMISSSRGIRFDDPYSIHFFSPAPGDIESKISIAPNYTAFRTTSGICGLYFDNNNYIHLISYDDSLTWTGVYLKIGSDTAATRAYAREYGGEGGSGTPGGTSGQIQWNDGGVFAGFGSWDGTQIKILTDTVAQRLWARNLFVEKEGSALEGNIAVWASNNGGLRGEGNLRWDDDNYELEIDGRIYFNGYLLSSVLTTSNVPAFRFYTLYTQSDLDTIIEIRNNTKVLLRMFDDSTAHYGNLHNYGHLKVNGTYPGRIPFVGTYTYISEIADTAGKVTIPASMNGLELKDMQVTSDNNADRVVSVNVKRQRGATINTMTSTPATLGAEYTCSDETINTTYDDIQTGDAIFITWTQGTGTNRHVGLYVTLEFR